MRLHKSDVPSGMLLRGASRFDKQPELLLQQFPLQHSIRISLADEIWDQQQTPEQAHFSGSQNAMSVEEDLLNAWRSL